jgi:hypothetical protein
MNYLKTELEFVNTIMTRGGATYEDKLKIMDLYKKYVDPTLASYTVTNSVCNSCNTSLNKYWTALKEFISANSDKFVK